MPAFKNGGVNWGGSSYCDQSRRPGQMADSSGRQARRARRRAAGGRNAARIPTEETTALDTSRLMGHTHVEGAERQAGQRALREPRHKTRGQYNRWFSTRGSHRTAVAHASKIGHGSSS